MEGISEDYSLGYVRGFADTHVSLHLNSEKSSDRRAIAFRNLDQSVLDDLVLDLKVLNYEFKRYV